MNLSVWTWLVMAKLLVLARMRLLWRVMWRTWLPDWLVLPINLVNLMTPALCRPLSPLAILASNIRIHCGSVCSWSQYYPVLSFLMSGHLNAEYERLSSLLRLPACSSSQWGRIVAKLEEHVTNLAEWSCGQVRQEIVARGDTRREETNAGTTQMTALVKGSMR